LASFIFIDLIEIDFHSFVLTASAPKDEEEIKKMWKHF